MSQSKIVRILECDGEEYAITGTMEKAFLIIAGWAFVKEEKGFRCINVENEDEFIFFEVEKCKSHLTGYDKYLLQEREATISGEKYWEVKYLAERNREFLFLEWEGKLPSVEEE